MAGRDLRRSEGCGRRHHMEKLSSRTIVKDGLEVEYYVYRLTRADASPGRRTSAAAARRAGTGSASGRATTSTAP
jgi:hypothetical protein